MKLIWITDPHFDRVDVRFPRKWGKSLANQGDETLITGDIAEHISLEYNLTEFAKGFGKPVHFVLGNHDFYGGSFARTTGLAKRINNNPNINWLREEIIELTTDTILLGSEGWYDCKVGNPYRLGMEDHTRIEDFAGHHIEEIIRLSKIESENLALQADYRIRSIVDKYKNIIFGTHVPPFPPEKLDQTWDPWFVSINMGNALVGIAEDFPDKTFTILAGHRHRPMIYNHRNLTMFVGEAHYNNPSVAKIIEVK